MTLAQSSNDVAVTSRTTGSAYWFYDSLLIVLVAGSHTGGSFSLVEQWMRRGSSPMPHVHNYTDEWFYVVDGTLEMTVGGECIHAGPGDSVWIPRGTVHSFVVTSDVCHALNGYTPAGPEEILMGVAGPAETRTLPPVDLPPPDERSVRLLFNNYFTSEVGTGWEQTTADRRA